MMRAENHVSKYFTHHPLLFPAMKHICMFFFKKEFWHEIS